MKVANERGIKYLEITWLWSDVGDLYRRISAREQVWGIQNALDKIKNNL